MRTSRIRAWYQNPKKQKKHLIFAQFVNSPRTGVFGSHFVLDCGGSRKQAARFQDLLQQPSHPYLNGRANAESACVTTNRKSPLLSMATSLSFLISDTSGCVIFRRLSIAPVSGQLWEDFQLNHLVLAFLVAARFADPIRFTPTVCTPRDRVRSHRLQPHLSAAQEF